MKKIILPLLLLMWLGCKKKYDYTMKLYFLKKDKSGQGFVEWREKGFDAPTDSLAYEYALEQYLKEGHKRDIINGTPAKFEVYNREGKQITIAHGFY